ncbi:MAG: HigA family addiction module antitoxin [Candidatus Wallbacteria bacterium]|nr:HigA family addiction module antitoxin [Candidatus Wallbacteria bacterium]
MNNARPFIIIPPGEILKDELDERGWTQDEFADIIGRPIQVVNEIIKGKKAITPETAVLFSAALGTSADFWLNLENSFRLDLIFHEKQDRSDISLKARIFELAPVKEMVKRKWITGFTSTDELHTKILRFYDIPDLDQLKPLSARLRKAKTKYSSDPSIRAWQRKAEIEAEKLKVKKYSKALLSKLADKLALISGSTNDADTAAVPALLAETGVRFVLLPHLSKTSVDGAAFWIEGKFPVIAMTLRLDRKDNFWFTLLHEIAHLLNKDTRVDIDLYHQELDAVEIKANEFAANHLIPEEKYQEFLDETEPLFTRNRVKSFAEKIGVHPSIVVGRLQYDEKIPWSNLRNLMESIRPVFAKYITQ